MRKAMSATCYLMGVIQFTATVMMSHSHYEALTGMSLAYLLISNGIMLRDGVHNVTVSVIEELNRKEEGNE